MIADQLSVVTASLAQRAPLLEFARRSVPAELPHLIWIDDGQEPMQNKYNALVNAARTDWVAFLDDDNYWLASHLGAIGPHLAQREADLIYTYDAGPRGVTRVNSNGWSRADLAARLEEGKWRGWIDNCCAIRRDVFLSVGGFDPAHKGQDYELQGRLYQAGHRFLCVPRTTWVYRTPQMRAEFMARHS